MFRKAQLSAVSGSLVSANPLDHCVASRTSLRTTSPHETLEAASRLIKPLGITRLVEATDDDILGVPVWFAERPGGVASRLHAGKGLVSIDAQVGAVMEAIEYAVAELDASTLVGKTWSLADITFQFGPAVSIAHLAPILAAPATPDRIVLADACDDVATGRTFYLPAELVRMPAPAPADGCWLFGWSSNGLASGNSIEEATLHALLEVLERDCVAMDFVRPSSRWLIPDSLPSPLGQWAERWAGVGVDLHVRDLPNEFGLPCFEACLAQHDGVRDRSAYGWGLHPQSDIAVARAISEAAQSRLYAMRDLGVESHPVAKRVDPARRTSVSFSDVPSLAGDRVTETLDRLLRLLRQADLPWVLRRRMDGRVGGLDLGGLSVVKVVVPGCESSMGGDVRIGRRLANRLLSSS